jgi:hypothetical protein
LKLRQERAGNKLELMGLANDFLNRIQMAQQLRERFDKWDYMKLSQTNKNVMFLFIFFLFCKNVEQKGYTGPTQGGGLAPVGEGDVADKVDRMVNTVQKMCTHACM